MKRAVWMSALVLSCATSAEGGDGRERGGGADPCATDLPREVRDGAATIPADTAQAPRIDEPTLKPRLLNPEDVERALAREYRRVPDEAWIGDGDTTVVHLFVDEEGCVADMIVKESSGNEGLDNAALRVLGVAKFAPAMNQNGKVGVWVEWAVSFTPRGKVQLRV